jgi:hypothetical protein
MVRMPKTTPQRRRSFVHPKQRLSNRLHVKHRKRAGGAAPVASFPEKRYSPSPFQGVCPRKRARSSWPEPRRRAFRAARETGTRPIGSGHHDGWSCPTPTAVHPPQQSCPRGGTGAGGMGDHASGSGFRKESMTARRIRLGVSAPLVASAADRTGLLSGPVLHPGGCTGPRSRPDSQESSRRRCFRSAHPPPHHRTGSGPAVSRWLGDKPPGRTPARTSARTGDPHGSPRKPQVFGRRGRPFHRGLVSRAENGPGRERKPALAVGRRGRHFGDVEPIDRRPGRGSGRGPITRKNGFPADKWDSSALPALGTHLSGCEKKGRATLPSTRQPSPRLAGQIAARRVA